jgi:hypothetical protein
MDQHNYPKSFLNLLKNVKGKRSQIVVQHILEHGYITSEELQRQYGYEHPPRAVRDVREQGIPIETFRITTPEGKSIAAYRFGDPSEVKNHRLKGRIVLPKSLKETLIQKHGSKCAICLFSYGSRYLQIDHRIPYEVAGDDEGQLNPDDFMLLCGSCNRAKSWSCEHCSNWTDDQDLDVCKTCYWASPENYNHVSLQEIRRVKITWSGNEISDYNKIEKEAILQNKNIPDYIKEILKKFHK